MEYGGYWASDHKDVGFNLCVVPLQIAHPVFQRSGDKSGVKGGKGRVVCPTFKWTRSSNELRKGIGKWNST
jgi:hypothetical protein